ncbi:hypothetical protein EV647_4115 [Kribbella sp. VKM Ac-2566]|nr:hypothetical protein EV647_4115 [Kribbella sp. VKM Ac-2566]
MSEGIRNHRTSAFAVLAVAFAAGTLGTLEASASPREPDSTRQPAQSQDGWPDEGSGYPGYGDPSPTNLVPDDWPDERTGYPEYADQAPATGARSTPGLDATSIALGAMGGIALGGAALGTTLVVQRRRDNITQPTG